VAAHDFGERGGVAGDGTDHDVGLMLGDGHAQLTTTRAIRRGEPFGLHTFIRRWISTLRSIVILRPHGVEAG
jgi:hypothetical protein